MVPLSEIIEKADSILWLKWEELKQNAKQSKLNNLNNIIIDEMHCGGFRIICMDENISKDDIRMLCKSIYN